MFIKFQLANFRSFNELTSFDMIGLNSIKRFRDHTFEFDDKLNILKSAGIYGPNGSGKTNLFKALYFLKRMIIDDRFHMESEFLDLYHGYKLIPESKNKPAVFQIEFLLDDKIFSYRLEMLRRKIYKEELCEIINYQNAETAMIFSRYKSKTLNLSPKYFSKSSMSLYSNIFKHMEEQSTFIAFSQFISTDNLMGAIYDWFDEKVHFSFPFYEYQSTSLIELLCLHPEYMDTVNRIISSSDMGISAVELERFDSDTFFGETRRQMREMIYDRLLSSDNGFYSFTFDNNYCGAVLKDEGENFDEFEVVKLYTLHTNEMGKEVPFELNMESRGVVSFINLIPALIKIHQESCTYFIDEISLSIHPVLIKDVIFKYLGNLNQVSRGQIIFNSHEAYLMNEKCVRQDEVWFCKFANGTSLYPLTDFKPMVRHDFKYAKNYLSGLFGAIPDSQIDISPK